MDENFTTAVTGHGEADSNKKEILTPTPLHAPHYYGSSFQIIGSSNDMTIVLGRALPYFNTVEGGNPFTIGTEPQAILHLSPHTAKELMILLQLQVAEFEAEFGKLETPFTRAQAGTGK